MPAQFLLITCQPGAETALKSEMQGLWPDARPAYSRPGFVTFKFTAPIDAAFDPGAVFARSWCLSLGRAKGTSTVELSQSVAESFATGALHPAVLQLWAVEQAPVDPAFITETYQRVATSLKVTSGQTEAPVPGDLVADVVVLTPTEWWVGCHLHSDAHRPWAGGIPPVALPPEAPSRAYLKASEALLWPGLPMRANDTVLELGSAPGGASWALLERGYRVIGVDPGDMADAVRRHSRFRHIHKQALQLSPDDLEGGVQWLFSDMNVPAAEVLQAVARVVKSLRSPLRGCVLTIKLKDWNAAKELPAVRERLQALGFGDIRMAQLYNNRREITVVAQPAP